MRKPKDQRLSQPLTDEIKLGSAQEQVEKRHRCLQTMQGNLNSRRQLGPDKTWTKSYACDEADLSTGLILVAGGSH